MVRSIWGGDEGLLDRLAGRRDYHIVFVTDDGTERSFRGTYLEVEPPTRTAETGQFDRWPGVEAVESTELREVHGVTKLTQRLAFRDKAAVTT